MKRKLKMGKVIVPRDTDCKKDFMIGLGDEAFSLRGLAQTVEEIWNMLHAIRHGTVKEKEKK